VSLRVSLMRRDARFRDLSLRYNADVTAPLILSPAVRRAFDRLAADLRRVFGDRFVALVAYSPGASAAFAVAVTADDLDACSALVEGWHRDGLATPLVMSPAEFRRSLDTFPLEYQAILDRHVLVDGRTPFEGCAVDRDDLRRACEAQARGHLIHLRQGWLEAGGHPHELAAVIERSAAPLRALLTSVARLQQKPADTRDDLAAFAEHDAGMPGPLVRDVLDLEQAPERSAALSGRIREYLTAAERLWRYVDTWQAS
jgi:hypothetical protein